LGNFFNTHFYLGKSFPQKRQTIAFDLIRSLQNGQTFVRIPRNRNIGTSIKTIRVSVTANHSNQEKEFAMSYNSIKL